MSPLHVRVAFVTDLAASIERHDVPFDDAMDALLMFAAELAIHEGRGGTFVRDAGFALELMRREEAIARGGPAT